MLISILMLFAAAAGAPWLYRAARGATGWVLATVPLVLFLFFAAQLRPVADAGALRTEHPWVPELGVTLSFHLDGLALLFALLITGLGTLIVVYAGSYLHGHAQLGRFFLFLLLFMGSMLGLVLSDNLLSLFVFWELTSISSYLLIGFDHEREEARKSALQALLVTGTGGLALLAGFLLLSGAAGGAMELSEIRAQGDAVRLHALYPWIFALVALGAFTKSAQVPFHFWLPNAMAAPTPVSAFLHSATMVKAGIYLLARLDPTLGGTALWTGTLTVAGSVTMLTGAVMALRQTDLKKVLAYSTITALGTLTLLLGLGFDASVKAAIVFLFVHSLYKGALFMTAGAVDHETGTRDVRLLGGLRRAMPWTAAGAALAGLSMAGLPPLFGFIGKELAYKAKLGFEGADILLPAAAVLANALTVAAAGMIALRPFWGPARPTPKAAHEAPLALWLGPVVLGAAGLVLGLVPSLVAEGLVGPAVAAVLGTSMPIKLTLWYGFNTALLLSVATAALGVALYRGCDRIRGALARADGWMARGPERGYDRALEGVLAVAARQADGMMAGGVRGALRTVVALACGLALWALLAGGWPGGAVPWPAAAPHEWALAVLMLGGTVAALVSRSRTSALLSLGVVGTSVALLFALLGAPDLAITQLLVETLVVVIALAVLRRLPALDRVAPPRGRERMLNAAVAVGAGGTMAALLLAVHRVPFYPVLGEWLTRESVPSGFGQNVVNVILVDFRALDTLGEITVLAVAALGAHALIRMRPRRAEPRLAAPPSLIVQAAARFLIPLLAVAAAFLLWRGHNAPGGGFIAGLVAAGALALCVVAFGARTARRVAAVDPRALIGTGLGVALVSGLFALAAGETFMAAQWASVPTGSGPLKLGTPLLFDVGVFLVVVGFVFKINLALEEG
jgi:multicomponent Na+:H+ antiporter subunit A